MLLVLLFVCVGWHTMPGNADVVPSFEGKNCSKFFFRETPPNIMNSEHHELTPGSNLARICQRFKNQFHYATLYDRLQRIPVYSAYIYKPAKGPRSSDWMVEPELFKFPPDMASENALHNIIMESQAVLKDYENLTYYDKGQLNPSCSQRDQDDKKATFTLTNVVPMYIPLKNGYWYHYECEKLPKIIQDCTEAFAVVGAVPGNTYTPDGRVNIPSCVWSAGCCSTDKNSLKSWGMIAMNNNTVNELPLGELETRLAVKYHQNGLSLFHRDCPRQ